MNVPFDEMIDCLRNVRRSWERSARQMDADPALASDDMAAVYRECAEELEQLTEDWADQDALAEADKVTRCAPSFVSDFVTGVQDAIRKREA